MSTATQTAAAPTVTEYHDVLIIGAGLSGIGAAYHLMDKSPGKTYAILEGRENFGGTWDLFKYPGIRSDSDMYTLGYNFKPWKDQDAIADAPKIMSYLQETMDEYGIKDHIRFQHYVKDAQWSSEEARWTVEVERRDTGETVFMSCNFLFMCTGYYSYTNPHNPEFEGRDDFKGEIVHPQFWTDDIDHKGKKVVVIGSGATAVTLVPSMADEAEHVTMLQRSPTYVVSMPRQGGPISQWSEKLPGKLGFAFRRFMAILMGMLFFQYSRKKPENVKRFIIGGVKEALGPDYDVKKHFTPSYNPWDQRVCLVPDADLFETIKAGKASVVTDHIDRFVEDGILLKSGEKLEADMIVTATGLRVEFCGGASLSVDGRPVSFNERMFYKGMMLSDTPNFAYSFGYTNASWTLKADLTCSYVTRLLNHMDKTGTDYCVPRLTEDAETESMLDFTSGYCATRSGDHA